MTLVTLIYKSVQMVPYGKPGLCDKTGSLEHISGSCSVDLSEDIIHVQVETDTTKSWEILRTS